MRTGWVKSAFHCQLFYLSIVRYLWTSVFLFTRKRFGLHGVYGHYMPFHHWVSKLINLRNLEYCQMVPKAQNRRKQGSVVEQFFTSENTSYLLFYNYKESTGSFLSLRWVHCLLVSENQIKCPHSFLTW